MAVVIDLQELGRRFSRATGTSLVQLPKSRIKRKRMMWLQVGRRMWLRMFKCCWCWDRWFGGRSWKFCKKHGATWGSKNGLGWSRGRTARTTHLHWRSRRLDIAGSVCVWCYLMNSVPGWWCVKGSDILKERGRISLRSLLEWIGNEQYQGDSLQTCKLFGTGLLRR